MKKISIGAISIISMCSPIIVLAQAKQDFKWLINDIVISGLLKPIVPLLIGLAVVVFIYGVLTMMLSEGGEKKEDGKQYMIWGIVGIFVMVSVWGLVAILADTFKLDNGLPQVQMNVPNVQINP